MITYLEGISIVFSPYIFVESSPAECPLVDASGFQWYNAEYSGERTERWLREWILLR